MTQITNKLTNETISVNLQSLVGKSTKSLYFRTHHNGVYLSRRGFGGTSKGDVCKVGAESAVVNAGLFKAIKSMLEPRSVGRPAADYKTTTIAFRVRVEHADDIRNAVKELQRKLIATPLQK